MRKTAPARFLLASACLVMIGWQPTSAQNASPWPPAEMGDPPPRSSVQQFTGGTPVPGPPIAPLSSTRPAAWPGGPTPQREESPWAPRGPSQSADSAPADSPAPNGATTADSRPVSGDSAATALASPLLPCQRAITLALVASDPILAADLIASAEENMQRLGQQQLESAKKKLTEAGQEADLPKLAQQLEEDRKKWVEELRTAINEAAEPGANDRRLSPAQSQRREMLQNLLKQQIDTKLVYYDAKRNIPAENLPHLEKQADKQFELTELKKLLQSMNVETWPDLDAELRKRGSSLQREKQAFLERMVAQQWLWQEVKFDEEVTYDQMLNYYRDHPDEFERPTVTRWQMLNVPFSEFPSKSDAYAAIARLGNQVMDGADFATVARTASSGSGGSDGTVRQWPDKSRMIPSVVEKSIEGLPGGSMSPILEDWRGYYIVRVVERVPAHRETFETAQSDIREKVKKQRNNEQMEKYLRDLREKVPVWTILDDLQVATRPERLRY